MKIIIPMAGESKRFSDRGYKLPKPFLQIGHKSMIEGVLDLFDPANDDYTFIINESDAEKHELGRFLENLSVKKCIYVIKGHSQGPLYSLLQIVDKIPDTEEVIVNYCDFLLDWDYKLFLEKIRKRNYDGGLVSFRGFHPASLGNTYYAYMRVNTANELLELREKECFTNNRMEEHASTGTYYFRRWGDVVEFGKELLGKSIKSNNEYYPSLIYNLMGKTGRKSLVFEAKKFICLGTPEDYEQYKFWHEIFSIREK